jgi:hypothetical protein
MLYSTNDLKIELDFICLRNKNEKKTNRMIIRNDVRASLMEVSFSTLLMSDIWNN